MGSGGALVLGQEQDSINGGFVPSEIHRGSYFDLAIYNTAWDQATVAAHSGRPTVDRADRIAHWDFNSMAGGVVSDQEGLRDLTLTTIAPDGSWISGNASALGSAWGLSVAENAANGTQVARITAIDFDAPGSLTYSVQNNAGGRFAIDSTTGIVTVADGTLLNFESATSHSITVRATDQGGLTYDELFTISVTDVNEAPIATHDSPTILRGLAQTINVLSNDSDSDGNTLTITHLLDPSAPGIPIAIAAGTPVTLASGVVVQLQANGTFLVTNPVGGPDSTTFDYTISDGNGLSATATVSLSVLDLDMVEQVNGPIFRNGDGNFVVPIRVSLTNSGAISVASPQIRKLLSSDFGSYFHSVSNISLNTSGVLQGTAPTLDAAFNGSTTTSMLQGGNLAPNDTVVVTMDVIVKNAASVMPNLINPSFFTGTNLSGMPLPYSLDALAGSQSFTGAFNDTAPAAWDGTFSLNITRVGSGTVTRPSSISMSLPWTHTDDSGNNLVFGERSFASIQGSMTAGNPNDYTFNYDFSGLVNGYLPAGTSIWFSDVDNAGQEYVRISGLIAGGTGQSPFLTPLAQSGTGTPAAFSYNSTTGLYSLDAVAPNNGLLQGFVTTHNLTSLSIQAPHLDVVNSTSYSFFLAAPSDGSVELSTQAHSNNTVNGVTIIERADTGNTHESSNPGTLGDSGGRSDATRISIPMIEVQQSAATPVRETSWNPGHFDVTYDITVSNAGLNTLENLTLAQNFASQLGAAFVRIVPQGGSPVAILASNASDNPGLNVSYDGGTTNANLFDGSPSQLGLTQSLTLRVVVEINPYAVGAIRDGITGDGNGDFETQAYATAIETRYGATITDLSDNPANAINADANGDGNPDDATGIRPTLPTAAPDTLTTAEDTTLSTNVITANGIDLDPNGDTLTIQSATLDLNGDGTQDVLSLGIPTPVISNGQSIGVLTLSANGSLIFVPATDYYGNVPRITYVVNDGNGNTDSTTIDISVTSVNDAPVGVNDVATAIEAGGVANATAGTNPTGNVLTNDTDVDAGDTKTVIGVSAGVQPLGASPVSTPISGTYGSITIAANGSYTYTVDNNNPTVQALRTSANTLTDTFTYTMRDTAGLTSTTQITVTIQGANDAPVLRQSTGAFVKHFSGSGEEIATPAGETDLLLNSFLAGDQRIGQNWVNPGGTKGVAYLRDAQGTFTGEWVAVWSDNGSGDDQGIFLQKFAADGSKIGTSLLVNTTTSSSQRSATVVALADGGFVVGWTSAHDGTGAYARIYENNLTARQVAGSTSEFRLHQSSTPAGFEQGINLVAMQDGGFTASWSVSTTVWTPTGQRFDANGTRIGGEFPIHLYGYTQYETVGFDLGNQGMVYFWMGWAADGNADVAGQYYSFGPDGTPDPVGASIRINQTSAGVQGAPSAAYLGGNKFIVTWHDPAFPHGLNSEIYGRFVELNEFGALIPQGNDFQINQYALGTQSRANVAALLDQNGQPDGRFAVSWMSQGQDGSGWGVFARIYSSSGEPLGAEFQVASDVVGDQAWPTVVATPAGGFAVSWTGIDDLASAALVESNAALSAQGTLSISDPDQGDLLQIAVTNVSASGQTTGLTSNHAALLAMLTTDQTTHPGGQSPISLHWSFHSGTEAFDYLLSGETLQLVYTISVTDSSTVTTEQQVTITVSGTQEAPVATPDTAVAFAHCVNPMAIEDTKARSKISRQLGTRSLPEPKAPHR